jgi:hypothetical protein
MVPLAELILGVMHTSQESDKWLSHETEPHTATGYAAKFNGVYRSPLRSER